GVQDRFTRTLIESAKLVTVPARDRQPFEIGHAYLAPIDHHLLLENGLMRVETGPKEQHWRPCIDVLFKSAAAVYGPRVMGVLLSGMASDGTAGLWHIQKRGGVAIVQDPADAEHRVMPESAVANMTPDFVLPVRDIGAKLVELSEPPAGDGAGRPRILIVED